jgi:hypothetical protein
MVLSGEEKEVSDEYQKYSGREVHNSFSECSLAELSARVLNRSESLMILMTVPENCVSSSDTVTGLSNTFDCSLDFSIFRTCSNTDDLRPPWEWRRAGGALRFDIR